MARDSNGMYLCAYCGFPINGSMIGAGTGEGDKFAHLDCYWKEQFYHEQEKSKALQEKLDNVMEAICDECYLHIENINLKEVLK
jgi:hypothetical protein